MPVPLVARVAVVIMAEHDGKHITDGFIQGTGLMAVSQRRKMVNDGMGKLVCGDIQLSKTQEQRGFTQRGITGTKNEVSTVPERIAIAAPVMCHGRDSGIAVIERFVIKNIVEKTVNDIKVFKHIVRVRITENGRIMLCVFCFPVFPVIQRRNGSQVFQMHNTAVYR